MKFRNIFLSLVCLIGSFQVIGYATGSQALRGIGLVSGFAPFPKVFCEADGYEPFAARFVLSGQLASGESIDIEMTPEIYSRLSGPYIRRNVYGAALAYAPRLPKELRQELHSHLPQLFKELGLPELSDTKLTVYPREGEGEESYTFEIANL